MHSAAIHLLRRLSREDAAAGRYASRLSALSVLVFGGSKTVTELAVAERVRVPTMSKMVSAMQEEGLVRRERHEKDARAVRLHATSKGRRVLEQARDARLSLLERLLADADERELTTIREAAEIVERALRSA